MEMFELAAQRAGFALDSSQFAAARRLTALGEALTRRRRLLGRVREVPPAVRRPGRAAPARGLYLWGPVGRGKSWLADTFYESLELRHKHRVHFHEFFREFHAAYARHRGDRAAADLAVAQLLGDCRFLYFDEFHVHDPGDAMMIGRVLRSLVDRRITLLATSNYRPAELLPDPVHHPLFAPAIALLEGHLDVVEVAGPRDHRAARRPGAVRTGFERGGFLRPGTEEQFAAAGLRVPGPAERESLTVRGRGIAARAVRGDLVWFDFHELCSTPTSTLDYLDLADRFGSWVLSGLPRLRPGHRDAAQRFANLVDVLCDRGVRLHLAGEAPPAECLGGGALPLDLDRTVSRLGLLPDLAAPEASRTPAGA
ncbi:cell division protein ZapE [Streptomyces physcomitrii]|uniref:Cell division protein ZapE n=1 Tax=Streptomyces physcomitrii TaxID=2724184 RepID=A0ABX1H858_9ACTN|nr:cell division protein ZapE [Streptomyces physcomitrii]NKI44258.1 cell division protein ZapE [Streptomyces physcomitrii]